MTCSPLLQQKVLEALKAADKAARSVEHNCAIIHYCDSVFFLFNDSQCHCSVVFTVTLLQRTWFLVCGASDSADALLSGLQTLCASETLPTVPCENSSLGVSTRLDATDK